MRFFITELPILPFSAEAPITATAFGFMIRFIWRTMSSWLGRGRGGFGAKSTTMRTSAAIALVLVANTGFKSISAISGKSVISFETLTMISAITSGLAGW